MESFAETLESLVNLGPARVERFGASLPQDWIEEALNATGTASIRRRKLPAEQVLWLVLGMALFQDRSIRDVVDHLGLVMPGDGKDSLAPSAVSNARGRLGPKPVEWLFNRVAANFEHFGKPGGRGGAGDAGYPQLRLACLMNLGTRMLVAARFGPFATSEQELADALWASVPPKSITILDRGFVDYTHFASFIELEQERHLLVRMRDNMKPEPFEELPDGSLKVRLKPSRDALKATPTLPSEIVGRVIAYQHPDGKPSRLFTTLDDHKRYPADELIALYHDRWDIELAYDELKTHMLDRKECLRCKSPDRVAQELWGLLLTYNLVRREMLLVATTNKLSPRRISFVSSLMWITNFWIMAWRTSPANVPKHLGEFHSKLKVLFLPERRSERRYPRHVKIKMSNFPRNRGKPRQALIVTSPERLTLLRQVVIFSELSTMITNETRAAFAGFSWRAAASNQNVTQ